MGPLDPTPVRGSSISVVSVVPAIIGGVAFAGFGLFFGWRAWAAHAWPMVAIFAVPTIIGIGLIGFAARQLYLLAGVKQRAVRFPAVVQEVRRDVDAGARAQTEHWTVVAVGRWPDGREEVFESAPIASDPRAAIAPGQSVSIDGDVRTRAFVMDVSHVQGSPAPRISAPPAQAGTPTGIAPKPRPVQPKAGAAVGAAIVAVGLVLGLGADKTIGLIVAGFGVMILVFVWLGWRTQRRIAAGVRFQVVVSDIVHSQYHSAGADRDAWNVTATGAWPDGRTQTFYSSQLTQLGTLGLGDRLWVRGDPVSGAYEVEFGA